MKHKHLFSLLDKSYTTVQVIFNLPSVTRAAAPPTPPPPASKRKEASWGSPSNPFEETHGGFTSYTYKVPRSWFLKEEDVLLVLAQGVLCLATVVTVHADPELDLDANFEYQWAIQRIDFNEHQRLVEREKQFNWSMQQVERVKQRELLLESVRSSLPPGSAALALFESTTASIEVPPAPPPMSGSEAPPEVPTDAAPWEQGA